MQKDGPMQGAKETYRITRERFRYCRQDLSAGIGWADGLKIFWRNFGPATNSIGRGDVKGRIHEEHYAQDEWPAHQSVNGAEEPTFARERWLSDIHSINLQAGKSVHSQKDRVKFGLSFSLKSLDEDFASFLQQLETCCLLNNVPKQWYNLLLGLYLKDLAATSIREIIKAEGRSSSFEVVKSSLREKS